jgi:hypothetical protein
MLVYQGGTPAGTFHTAVPNWRLGDKFESGGEMFRILDIDAANPPEGTYGVFTVEAVDKSGEAQEIRVPRIFL